MFSENRGGQAARPTAPVARFCHRCLRVVLLVMSALSGAGCTTSAAPAAPAAGARDAAYPPEAVHETAVHPDEALVNVSLTADRWPDCTTLGTAIEDIFRLEGVRDRPDQDKALALWKWFRILVSGTGGAYAYEGSAGKPRIVYDPHAIFTAYGHHQCDGQSWALAPLWRAAGYVAFDECTHGHTIASLRYRDADGQMRFHDFDPQGRFYYWDDVHKRVGTWTVPLIRGRVHRHLLAPQKLHSLRTSLRVGETVERRWDNSGHLVPARPPDQTDAQALATDYYRYRPGRTDGVYAAVGEEVQTLEAEASPERHAAPLCAGSVNTACTPPGPGNAALHPAKAGEVARFIYRLAPPYVVADARCEAVLVKGADGDLCTLAVSTDGVNWQPLFVKEKTGEEKVSINLGREARAAGRPDVYTAYDFYIKAEFRTAGDVRSVGASALAVTAWRQLNKRTLPNLRPGRNVLRVTADRLAPGLALELEISYRVDGQPKSEQRVIAEFPHYFEIDVPGVAEQVLANYDKDFNTGALQMAAIRMKLVPAAGAAPSRSLPEARARSAFAASAPHPADMTDRKIMKKTESDVIQTSGFFPQSRARLDDDAAMNALVAKLRTGKIAGNIDEKWLAAEDLGSYPKAADALLEALPRADIDLTIFICKALAQIGDQRAVGPLLEKWKLGAAGAPGTRYIPDALAATGDRSVVPELIASLAKMRFDFRLHIAHTLGILGGPEAERALADLAANDPLRAVREEAAEALKALRTGR